MIDGTADESAEAIREMEAARTERARRDAALTPTERLERVHELCRQLSALRPIRPRPSRSIAHPADLERTSPD